MIPAAPAACGLFVPKLVVVLVGIATRGPRPRVTFCGTDVKLTESEIIDLRVAEAGARSTSRRRIRDDWRVDVHDLPKCARTTPGGRRLVRCSGGLEGCRESPRSTVARSSVTARGRRSAENPARAASWPRTDWRIRPLERESRRGNHRHSANRISIDG